MHYLFKTGVYLYALAIIVFGIQHFLYAGFVSRMVPGWIPFHLFWAYFTGAAMIAASVAIVFNKMARLACILLGIMVFLFVILIDIPPIITHPTMGGQLTTTFEEIGLGCCAFVLGSTFPEKLIYT